jgi:hypothetical protein
MKVDGHRTTFLLHHDSWFIGQRGEMLTDLAPTADQYQRARVGNAGAGEPVLY